MNRNVPGTTEEGKIPEASSGTVQFWIVSLKSSQITVDVTITTPVPAHLLKEIAFYFDAHRLRVHTLEGYKPTTRAQNGEYSSENLRANDYLRTVA